MVNFRWPTPPYFGNTQFEYDLECKIQYHESLLPVLIEAGEKPTAAQMARFIDTARRGYVHLLEQLRIRV